MTPVTGLTGVFILNFEHQSQEANMAEKTWQVEKIKHCEHVGHEVTIENELIFPAEFLPDTPPHVVAHRCSHATECNMIEHPVCSLCGTNPDINPV
jgi:hypothetical protein